MVAFLAHLLITAALLLFVANLVKGVNVEGWGPAFIGALVLGLVFVAAGALQASRPSEASARRVLFASLLYLPVLLALLAFDKV